MVNLLLSQSTAADGCYSFNRIMHLADSWIPSGKEEAVT